MKTTLSHLPEHKQAELKAIKEALVPRYGEIEMIILFGSYARGNWVEDKYVENGRTYTYKSDYDLLIILSDDKKANADSFVQAVSAKLEALKLDTPVHPIFHGIDFVNAALSEGKYFFDDIKREGILLFNTSRYELAEKRILSPLEIQKMAQVDFDQWFESANIFYDQYKNALAQNTNAHFKVAAFDLHQATERYYGAIQLVFTGNKPKTHDLEILGGMAKACDMEFGKVFPKGDLQERTRFTLLRKAYVDARYKAEYQISKADLEWLAGRVRILRDLTERICKAKIASFTA
jgi:predicted nucleotidyltransferase/HEPN domain-containing protein